MISPGSASSRAQDTRLSKNNLDRVAVCIPAYNAEATICRALQSVLRQTMPPVRIIVVDDCSLDNTACQIEKMVAIDHRIELIRNQQNEGPAKCRQIAIERALGLDGVTYVAFLDSDDEWFPEKLEKQLTFMRRQAAPVSFHAYEEDRAGLRSKSFLGHPREISLSYFLIHRQFGLCLSGMLHRSVAQELDFGEYSKQSIAEDLSYFIDAISLSGRAVFLPELLGRYYRSPHSRSHRKGHAAAQVFSIYVDRFGFFPGVCRWVAYCWNSLRRQ